MQKYAKFLKRTALHFIFFHKYDEMHDFGRERRDLWEKVAENGRNRICDPRTMVMQVKIPFNAFAFCGMVWYDDVGNGL